MSFDRRVNSDNKQRGREEHDTFPTTYRCNSKGQMRAVTRDTGLTLDSIEYWEGRPEYLRLTPITYLCGIAYERFVNCHALFAGFRAVIVAEFRKRI